MQHLLLTNIRPQHILRILMMCHILLSSSRLWEHIGTGKVCREIRYNVLIVSLLHEVAIQTYAASLDLRSTSFKFWSAFLVFLYISASIVRSPSEVELLLQHLVLTHIRLQHLICKEGASWLYLGIFNGYDTGGTPSLDVCGICSCPRDVFGSKMFWPKIGQIGPKLLFKQKCL